MILIWLMILCFLIGLFMFGVLVIGTLMFMWKPIILILAITYCAYRLAEFRHKRMKN
jgi:Flp pilus assembly protein TadB